MKLNGGNQKKNLEKKETELDIIKMPIRQKTLLILTVRRQRRTATKNAFNTIVSHVFKSTSSANINCANYCQQTFWKKKHLKNYK